MIITKHVKQAMIRGTLWIKLSVKIEGDVH